MLFPVVIHKDADSDYGVTVPDLPGCFSAGATLDEALEMGKEAIELHLEGLIEEGQPIPTPEPIDAHQANRDYRGGMWAVVTIDSATLRVRAKRINVTLPERVLEAADRFAEQAGETRSGLLARAVSEYINRHRDQRSPLVQPVGQKRRRLKKEGR